MLAAVLVTAIGCNGYDDLEIRNRLDELEDKVEAHEQWLKQLDASIKSLNEANGAFTALINGGLVTDVKPVSENGRTGYQFTITTGSSSSTYTIWNGDKGDQGEAPQIGVAQDEDGRYYWTLNGTPMTDENGNKIYASGYKGEQGDQGEQGETGAPGAPGQTGPQGWTPRLKVDKDPAKAGTEDEDTLYWWVGYDKNNDGQIKEEDGEEWENLGVEANVETGAASGLDMTYDEQNKQVTFTKNGVVIGTFDVYFGSKISVSFIVDEKTVEEYASLYLVSGETVEIETEIEGAGENAVIKAELLNAGYGYSVYVDGTTINVTAMESGKANKLLIEVLDGAACYHTWLNLEPVLKAWIEVDGCDDYGYMPIAFGQGSRVAEGVDFSALDNVPVQISATLNIDVPAAKDMVFSVFNSEIWEEYGDPFISTLQLPETVTIRKGETSAAIAAVIPSRANLVCDSYACIDFSLTDDGIINNAGGGEVWIANNFQIQASLSSENVHHYFGYGGVVDNLVDGDYTTGGDTNYSEGNFKEGAAFGPYLPTIATWGIYTDIDLPETVASVAVAYMHRSGSKEKAPTALNGEIGAVRIGAKIGADFQQIGYATQAADGLPCAGGTRNGVTLTASETAYWKSTAYAGNGTFSEVRFGVVRAYAASMGSYAGEDGYVDATLYPWTSFNINELEVYYMF